MDQIGGRIKKILGLFVMFFQLHLPAQFLKCLLGVWCTTKFRCVICVKVTPRWMLGYGVHHQKHHLSVVLGLLEWISGVKYDLNIYIYILKKYYSNAVMLLLCNSSLTKGGGRDLLPSRYWTGSEFVDPTGTTNCSPFVLLQCRSLVSWAQSMIHFHYIFLHLNHSNEPNSSQRISAMMLVLML